MNPPTSRPPSRFIRGRARGGGAYRPYFYFRRNGRTIPANRGGGVHNHHNASEAPTTAQKTSRRGRNSRTKTDNHPPITQLNSSFLQPQCYAAPEDALHAIQSINTDSPVQCPGWRLYFPQEAYVESSELAKRIKLIELHYTNNEATYNLLTIQRQRYCELRADKITNDEALMKVWPNVVEDMRYRPQRTLATFGLALHAAVTLAVYDNSLSLPACNSTLYVPQSTRVPKIYIRPVGFMDVHLMNTMEVDNLCCVRGLVIAIGSVEASASWIAYKCSRCRQEQALRQSGFNVSRPYSCKREGCLAKKNFVQERSSPYLRITPIQNIRLAEQHLQSLSFDSGAKQCLDIELRHDLVDSVVCGQEIIVTGILKMRTLAEEQAASSSHTNELYLKAVAVQSAKGIGHAFSERDLEAISIINAEPDSFKLLVHSLAPELHGHELAKAGVLLSLFGGAGSQIHSEAEINVLLVGDPGIGKSHLLQKAAELSGKGSLINGKRSSGATNALTAAVQGRSHYTINAGAILNANEGHCAIDDIDRLASQQETLLQVLQSKTISLPFTGLYATLMSPTSIIAAANSLRGHYDHSRLLTENTRLTTPLLRQFHLIYLLLDKPSKSMDTSLTEHIKAIQQGAKKSAAIAARYGLKPKMNNSVNMSVDDGQIEDNENYDLAERLRLRYVNEVEEEELDLLPPILMRKFITYARQQVKPLLNAEGAAALREFYMSLRESEAEENRCSINSSHLEGFIRLAQARARLDFSSEVTPLHVRDVVCLVRHSIADTSTSDYIDTNAAMAIATAAAPGSSQRSTVKRFLQMLQLRSNALARRVFDYDDLKEIATRAGITSEVKNLIDTINLQGYLLKKGPNLYEVMPD